MSVSRDRRTGPSDYSGPWSDLPPEATTRPREPLLKRPRTAREPWIRNWRALAIIAFLLFVAPPLAAWLSRYIMAMAAGG